MKASEQDLAETLAAIRDDKLQLPQLEAFRDSLIHFKTDLLLSVAKLKKAKALYLMRNPQDSAIARKMAWDASDEGQLLIQREAELRGLPDEIDGLMSRIYSAIR